MSLLRSVSPSDPADVVGSFAVADLAHRLSEVGRKDKTLQTMIFEPRALELRLAIGACPSTDLPLVKMELAGLLARKSE